MKKKLKNFFTLTRKADGGFTLVELIVVIAILAILGGVAVPAYSGYVAKAERAADEALLAELNTAFASACAINGQDHMGQTLGAIDLQDGEVPASYVFVDTPITDSFNGFYEGGKFKVFKGLQYNQLVGKFYEAFTLSLPGGGTLALTAEEYELLKGSTYSEHIGDLLVQIDRMGGLVDAIMGKGSDNAQAALANFKNSREYLTNMITALGGTVDPNATDEQLKTQFNDRLDAYQEEQAKAAVAKELNMNVDEIDWRDRDIRAKKNAYRASNDEEINKNVLILGVAQSAANATKEGALDIINDPNKKPKELLLDAMLKPNTTSNGMGNAALVYGMYTAFAKSDDATDKSKTAINGGATDVFNALGDEAELAAFRQYLNSPQGQKDADACVTAMQAINNTAGDANAAQGLINSGFANQDLIAGMENLFR